MNWALPDTRVARLNFWKEMAILYRIGKPRIVPRNKTDGRINKYGVNLSSEKDFLVLYKSSSADRELMHSPFADKDVSLDQVFGFVI
jgi:hypothetical protein